MPKVLLKKVEPVRRGASLCRSTWRRHGLRDSNEATEAAAAEQRSELRSNSVVDAFQKDEERS